MENPPPTNSRMTRRQFAKSAAVTTVAAGFLTQVPKMGDATLHGTRRKKVKREIPTLPVHDIARSAIRSAYENQWPETESGRWLTDMYGVRYAVLDLPAFDLPHGSVLTEAEFLKIFRESQEYRKLVRSGWTLASGPEDNGGIFNFQPREFPLLGVDTYHVNLKLRRATYVGEDLADDVGEKVGKSVNRVRDWMKRTFTFGPEQK